MAGLVIAALGCSCSSTHGVGKSPVVTAKRALSADQAAHLAADLANNQCDRQYRRRPFTAEQHPVVVEDGMYRWGGLNEGAPSGLSALVTFRQDGSEPHVEVYFSTDMRMRPSEEVPIKPLGP